MPAWLKRQLLLVLGVAIVAFLVAFRPIRIGPFEEYRVEMTLRFRLDKAASELAPKGKTFEQIVEDALEKAKVELATAEVVGEHLLVIRTEAPTKAKALALEDKIVKLIRKRFPEVHPIEHQREEKGVRPAYQIGNVGFFIPKPFIRLGLDLQGGTRVVMQCRRAEMQFRLEKPISPKSPERVLLREKLIAALRRAGMDEFDLSIDEATGHFITVRTQARNKAELNKQARLVARALRQVVGKVKEMERKLYPFTNDTVDTVIEIIRRRVDRYGVAEPQIYRQGDDRLVVELPGLRHAAEALKLIGETAILEIKLIPSKYRVSETETGRTIFRDPQGKIVPPLQVYLESELVIRGENLKPPCRVTYDEMGRPAVSFQLDREGTRKFAYYTRRNVGRYLGIWFDRECISAPVIREPIPSGKGQISGGFESMEEARDLKILLDAGALPVPVTVIWNRTISPTLGRDTIHKSIVAGMWGLVLIVAFMVFYYRLPGFLATLALVLYSLLVLAAFAAPIPQWRPTLTLPGVVGFLLSVGMAVDANVIIFERLKEELRLGKTLRTAIETAFHRAWTAILDANVTTLIAAFILYYYGTGPVQGFALTLSIGIIASLFSAIVATKAMLEAIAYTRFAEKRSWFLTLVDQPAFRRAFKLGELPKFAGGKR